MLNANVILSMVKSYTNRNNELSEDKLLELTVGLNEDEADEVLEILSDNNICVVEDAAEALTRSGDYRKLQQLTNEQLCVMFQQGNESALEALITKNERLVWKIAHAVLKDYRPEILEIEDLCSMGNMGLMKAAEKFKVSMGNKFSTYACWWIRQSITRDVMENGYGMRLPVHVFEQVIKANKVRKALNGGTLEEITDMLNSTSGRQYSVEEVKKLIVYGDQYLNTSSLNKMVGSDDSDTELMELIPCKENLEDEVMGHLLGEEIEKLLATLSVRENKIIRMRFGLDDDIPMTLEEVGKAFGITRERIRQIEANALRKLRHPKRAGRLEAYRAA